jgi:hypothetical protein
MIPLIGRHLGSELVKEIEQRVGTLLYIDT